MDKEEITEEILNIGRGRLLVRMPFLDRALYGLALRPSDVCELATDGRQLFYMPDTVIALYKDDETAAARIWLHSVLHCIFNHMYISENMDSTYWNLASDIAVENVMDGLGGDLLASPMQSLRRAELRKIRKLIPNPTAERIYRYLLDEKPEESLTEPWRSLFSLDRHEIWYAGGTGASGASHKKRMVTGEGHETADLSEGGQNGNTESSQAVWQKIARNTLTRIETFSKENGVNGAEFAELLKAPYREKTDYAVFLRRFAALTEVVRTSPDEFDYIFYTYGISLYGDMPLIEPLEYREDKRIRDLVIAIDTSGSVKGKTVNAFLQKTFDILNSKDAYAARYAIHIIECDAAITRDTVITSREDLEKYLEDRSFKGFGGTDFRPVFEYVETLRQKGELKKLKGLIYFTDGRGIYPEKMPDYQTAFAFIDREGSRYSDVPPWAIRVYLDEEALEL